MYPGSVWLGSLPINEIRSAVYGLRDKPLFMKLFKTNNIDHVKYCQHCFCFHMPSKLWQKRVKAFEGRFSEVYLYAFR